MMTTCTTITASEAAILEVFRFAGCVTKDAIDEYRSVLQHEAHADPDLNHSESLKELALLRGKTTR